MEIRGKRAGETHHVIVFPSPIQSHINPMLQFSKRLMSRGLRVTLVATTSMDPASMPTSIDVEFIPDGMDRKDDKLSLDDSIRLFETVVSLSLPELIEKLSQSDHPAHALVYDASMPWAHGIAERFGLVGAAFFTQSCAVTAIYRYLSRRSEIPVKEPARVLMPCMPPLGVDDLPSFVRDSCLYSAVLRLIFNQVSTFQKIKWIFFNSFDKLEEEVVQWLATHQTSVRTIGPTIPSMYMDKRLEDDVDYGLNLFKPNTDTIVSWLDTKDISSVVYISFGSMASLSKEQMEELALSLKRSNAFFLWVVRDSEEGKLPASFTADKSKKGLVVSWCCQVEVLAHKAVGCFMTHCGWNSVLEALSQGVPMIAMPCWADQPTNAKFVEDVWRVGVRVKVDEKGIARGEELEECIRVVMEEERGKEMKQRANKWKELAVEAVNDGGSSDNNIKDFVEYIVSS